MYNKKGEMSVETVLILKKLKNFVSFKIIATHLYTLFHASLPILKDLYKVLQQSFHEIFQSLFHLFIDWNLNLLRLSFMHGNGKMSQQGCRVGFEPFSCICLCQPSKWSLTLIYGMEHCPDGTTI